MLTLRHSAARMCAPIVPISSEYNHAEINWFPHGLNEVVNGAEFLGLGDDDSMGFSA